MFKSLSLNESSRIIQRILKGEQVSQVAREEGVSRTIIYRWLKRYKSGRCNGVKKISFKPHWKSLSKEKEKEIIKAAIKNPQYTVVKIASIAGVSAHGVWNTLKRRGLNTQKARSEYVQVNGSSMIKPVQISDRVSMIRRYEAGERVSDICRDFGISHTLFYRFLKRYQQADKERSALENFRPKGEKHWRYAPGIEEIVLKIVAEKPELTAEKLAKAVHELKGKKIIGAHGIYNLLKRLDLNTYEKRRQYADSQRVEEKQFVPIPAVTLPAAPQYSFISFLSPPFLKKIFSNKKNIGIAFISSLAFFSVLILTSNVIFQTQGFAAKIGIIFSLTSLFFGLFFFLYSVKYYISIAIVLSYSRREKGKGSVGGFLSRVFGVSIEIEAKPSPEEKKSIAGVGFQSDLSDVVLERNPFVSIHVGTYNEKRVIDRLLTACTSFDYPNYEVIVADDSNDETVDLINKWAHNPRIKISHRDNRDGYKGAALAEALKKTDKRAEYVMVFDADFIPYPDTITQFLKYFQKAVGTLDLKSQKSNLGDQASGSNIAAVQGYQWHVLNKSENWITRGVRSEYSGSYVIERSGAELYSGLKQISGSVYMIRRNVLQEIGWGRSITEDFELTLKLYEAGYKVIYTPYIQAPAEAVSTVKRLIRQRMRWAEGHSFNIKRMLVPLLFGRWMDRSDSNFKFSILNFQSNSNEQNSKESRVFVPSPLTFAEKLELVYLAPYYLQAAFFIAGTFCWFAAETIFQVRLPFWTEVWGWSLVITNLFALPFLNLIGLFMEEAEEKDYLGLLSFVVISYIVAPFQAYAAVKGFFEDEEGPWFRTPKTGRITDIFVPGRFFRYIRGIFGKPAILSQIPNVRSQNYISNLKASVALATANSRFDNFKIIRKPGKLFRSFVAIVLIFTMNILYLSKDVRLVYATNMTSPLKLSQGQAGDGTWPAWGNYITNNSNGYGTGTRFMFRNRNANSGTNNYTWYTNILPFGGTGNNAVVPAGQYFVQMTKSGGAPAANIINFGLQLLLTNNNGTSRAQLLWGTGRINTSAAANADNAAAQFYIGNLLAANNIAAAAPNRLAFRILWLNASAASANINWLVNNSTAPSRLFLPGALQVPEIPTPIIFIIMIVIIPIAPALVSGRFRRRGRSVFEEFRLAWLDLIKKLTGMGEEHLDELPV